MLTPRAYQTEGIDFLRSHRKAMLTDKPGLGKTLQAAEAATKPVLVSCPTYLVEQWHDFLVDQYPNDKVVMATGSAYKRWKAINQAEWDWLIVNHEMLRRFTMPSIQTFIIDESHHMRGRSAQQSKAAAAIAQVTPYVFELTGTPIVREPDDLFMQLHILYPQVFRSYYTFVEQWCKVISTPFGVKIAGARNPVAMRAMLMRYAMGRSYTEVGLQLPDLITTQVPIPMAPGLMTAYKQIKDQWRLADITFDSAAQIINQLRRVTLCSEKTAAAKSILEDSRQNGDAAVVFCWFRDAAEALGEVLSCPYIHGEMQATQRVKVAKSGEPVVVATLASLSEGVDLSHARTVIFFEEDYTPGIMEQALARVRRYSKNNDPVRAYYLTMKGTIDESIHKLVSRRQYDARAILRDALK